MTIGTPTAANATKILLLGSGELGKEVALEAMRLGCRVIACDNYADAPAMQVAHESHIINMFDRRDLVRMVKLVRPHFIVPEVEAHRHGYAPSSGTGGLLCGAQCPGHGVDHEPGRASAASWPRSFI